MRSVVRWKTVNLFIIRKHDIADNIVEEDKTSWKTSEKGSSTGEKKGSRTKGESVHASSDRHHAPVRASSRSTPTIAQYATPRVITLKHVHKSIHESLKNAVSHPLFRQIFALRVLYLLTAWQKGA